MYSISFYYFYDNSVFLCFSLHLHVFEQGDDLCIP